MTNKILFFLIPLFFLGCGEEKTTYKPKEQILNVDVITIKEKPIPLWVRYTARTRASNKQDILSRVSGILEKDTSKMER